MTEEIIVTKPKLKPKSRTNYIDTHIGRHLKNRRIMLGLSQQDLGDAVDVSVQQIQKYEKATNRISSSKLFSFAKLLNTPIIEFFRGIDEDDSSVFAEDQAEFLTEGVAIPERELLSLVRAFNTIADSNVRRKIIELARSLSDAPMEELDDEEMSVAKIQNPEFV
jgi:transcriptional regulator with XRE-family HTH domain